MLWALGLQVLAAVASGQSVAVAASAPDPPLPLGRPPEWSMSEGYGLIVHWNGGRSHEKAWFAHPGVSFRLSSRLEYLAEVHVGHFLSPGGYVVGALPIGWRLYLGHSARIMPYATLGMGVGWTNLTRLDEIDQRFNFLLQGGVGARVAASTRTAWTVEARVAHVSNAGASSPNLGLNMVALLGGFRFRLKD